MTKTGSVVDTTFEKFEETPAAKFAIGDKVRPSVGPHAGVVHRVIFAVADGGYNIRPELPVCRIQYRLGAAYARPEQLEPA